MLLLNAGPRFGFTPPKNVDVDGPHGGWLRTHPALDSTGKWSSCPSGPEGHRVQSLQWNTKAGGRLCRVPSARRQRRQNGFLSGTHHSVLRTGDTRAKPTTFAYAIRTRNAPSMPPDLHRHARAPRAMPRSNRPPNWRRTWTHEIIEQREITAEAAKLRLLSVTPTRWFPAACWSRRRRRG